MNKILGAGSFEGQCPKSKDKIIEEVEYFYARILESMGFDLNDPHLKNTPNRMAWSLVDEYCEGNYVEAPEITVFPNDDNIDHIVVSEKIDLRSMCSHHFAPFFGYAYIGYIPDQHVVGLSKFARVLNWYARRPQVQEKISEQVANHFMSVVKPKGFIIFMEGTHTCTTMRGAKQSMNSKMKNTVIRGGFEDLATRMEFYEMIRQR
jgi:GTP cyclohydrolase I